MKHSPNEYGFCNCKDCQERRRVLTIRAQIRMNATRVAYGNTNSVRVFHSHKLVGM